MTAEQMHVARILWNPDNACWEVVTGRGSMRTVVYKHEDIEVSIQWAKDNGYAVHVHVVTE